MMPQVATILSAGSCLRAGRVGVLSLLLCAMAGCADKASPGNQGGVDQTWCFDHGTCERCGDGVLGGAEQCDDGNLRDGDGCDSNCTPTGCGNGVVSRGEQCDDGNLIDDDGCDSNCMPTGCGNGVVTAGEECDDGNLVNGDGCGADCKHTVCGNGIVTAGEVCDDGNQVTDTTCFGGPGACLACRADCQAEVVVITPLDVTARAQAAGVALSWPALPGATGYRILYSASAGGPYAPLGDTALAMYDDATAPLGVLDFYVVRGLRGVVEGPDSNEVQVLPGRLVCVADRISSAVFTFDALADGDVAPLRVLGNLTAMADPMTMAYDPAAAELFVGNAGASLSVYGRAASGNVAAVRRIAGANTGLAALWDIRDMEVYDGEVYVATASNVFVYAAAAGGDVTPARRLDVSAGALGIDAVNAELLVTDGSAIRYYPLHFTDPQQEPLRRVISPSFAGAYFGDVLMRKGELVVTTYHWSDATMRRVLFFNPPAPADCDGANLCSLVALRELSGDQTGISYPSHMALDSRSDRLIVANYASNLVALFSDAQVAAGGNQAATKLFVANSAMDVRWLPGATAAEDELMSLTQNNNVYVYREDTPGVFSLNRTIGDAGVGWVDGVAADRAAGTVFGGFGPTRRFAVDATGWPAPQATLSGAPGGPLHVNGGELVAISLYSQFIRTYATSASGAASPLRQIDLTYTPRDLAVSALDTVYWTVTATPTAFIAAYDGTQTGVGTELVRIEGQATELRSPFGIEVDQVAAEIFVADATASNKARVLVYDMPASPGTFDVAPKRVLEGPATTLASARRLLVDRVNGELYVLDAYGVAVFALGAQGDTAPLRRIAGGATLLVSPWDFDFCR